MSGRKQKGTTKGSKLLNATLLRSAVNQAGESIMITDVEGKILFVNPAFERITGFSKDEVVGKTPRILKSGIHGPEFYREFWETILSGKTWTGVFVNKRKDGTLYHEQSTVAPVRDRTGRITHFVAIKEDVTLQFELQRRLTTLISNLPGFVYRCKNDRDWTMEYVSEGVFEITGYKPEDLINNARVSYASIIFEEDRDKVWLDVQEAIEEREPFQCEYRIKTATGEIRWVLEKGKGVFDAAGKLVALEGFITDITQYRLSQRALEEEVLRRRLLMEGSRDGIVVLDENGKAVEANRKFAEMLGYALEEIPSLYVWDWDAVWTKEELIERARTVGPEGEYFVTRHRRKDGSVFDVEVSTNAVWIGDRKYILCICRDITQKRRAEEELVRSVREWQTTFDATKDAIFLLDANQRIIRINKAAETFCRISHEKIVGQPCWVAIHNAGGPIRGCPFEQVKETLTRQTAELLVGDRWLEITIDPIVDDTGRFAGAVHIISDISERKRLEAQLLRAQRLEALGALASGIAHDLNNILTPVLMAAPLLRGSVPDPELAALVETIQKCAERGAGVVRQLLAFARGRPNMLIPISITHLLKEIRALLEETFPKNIQVVLNTDNGLWPITADVTQVHQAILNLCVNARDAMPNGGVLRIEAVNELIDEVFASMIVGARPGKYVRVSVVDTGIGIPPEHLDKIFDPFFTTKEPGKGTGLGLATVKRIMDGHSGFVRVTSQVGRGSRFDLFYPASPQVEPERPVLYQTVLPQGRGEKVMVIDDEVEVLRVIRRVLENHGYSVITASEGTEALINFVQNKDEINAVISDFMIGDVQGETLLGNFTKINPKVPVIIMTGLGNAPVISSSGAAAVLVKPFSAGDLLTTLHRVLSEWCQANPKPAE